MTTRDYILLGSAIINLIGSACWIVCLYRGVRRIRKKFAEKMAKTEKSERILWDCVIRNARYNKIIKELDDKI